MNIMLSNPLISIIIPIYNAELYLRACVDSVIKQSYTNLEIILVDDGSTDESGKMCDDYERIDSRVKVIHKMNGGQSDARNVGLDLASGDYICFVDSDDYVSNELIYVLLNLCIDNNVNVACADFCTFGEGKYPYVSSETNKIDIMSSYEYLRLMIWPWIYSDKFATVSVWNRLYKREVLKGLYFVKGKVYEDILFSTNAILAASKCVYINKVLYYYRLRHDSTTGNDEKYNEKWITDKLPMELEQLKILTQNDFRDLVTMKKINVFMDLARLRFVCDDHTKKKKIRKMMNDLSICPIEIIRNIPGWSNKIKVLVKVAFSGIYIYWHERIKCH